MDHRATHRDNHDAHNQSEEQSSHRLHAHRLLGGSYWYYSTMLPVACLGPWPLPPMKSASNLWREVTPTWRPIACGPASDATARPSSTPFPPGTATCSWTTTRVCSVRKTPPRRTR